MKSRKISVAAILMAALVVFSGCSTTSKTTKGALIGGGGGALLGAGIGALAGKGKGAVIGAAIGTAVGATTGAIIGNKMDKKQKELEALQNAKVQEVTDANGLKGILVTFDGGILFATGKSDLSATAQSSLSDFATKMSNMTDTDITIWGHTDNTGSLATNQALSLARAQSVATYLTGKGIASSRITTAGKADTMPVASNDTAAGKAQNRRVEIYITANAQMIQDAQASAAQ